MKILSIETSCDDTAVTIFEASGGITNASFKILANNSNSQIKIHIPYGGVFPALAKREHLKNLPILLEKTLKDARILPERGLGSASSAKRQTPAHKNSAESGQNPGIDLIAVTSGPGLEPALWTGITFAQELFKKWNIPVMPVNHMEGHILSPFGKNSGKFKIPKIKTPILSLLVSGGHTQLVLSKKWMRYEIIGETLDDAVGEAFDKVARMLGLPYPGGPEISKLAQELRASRVQQNSAALPSLRGLRHGRNFAVPALPRPMKYTKNFDFSFSGLKTAVLYLTRKIGKLDEATKAEIALEFENAAIECLTYKTAKAIEKYKIKTLIVGGGVAANQHLRSEMKKVTGKGVKLLFPTRELSTDNAIMIGMAGYLNFIKNKKKSPKPQSIKAAGNLRL
ncbi:MAG: tRNA (adenosine(37)-N6)-threonylcarbamoyltransferase complex transferase subunit TsaD [Patescibacteria group bacterium]